ncbi:hypothetical protein JVT61DRAFT_9925 [Boletus reticuloceps]|uniref:Uncharacterized protein n=1 Tax=Boletus reticuloceps TaxID=495285 RepID=A0A8I3A4C8_9AGAM|nr:hypothetical protein JVT61DRAFT_9925 [Boletus reticuloceps]
MISREGHRVIDSALTDLAIQPWATPKRSDLVERLIHKGADGCQQNLFQDGKARNAECARQIYGYPIGLLNPEPRSNRIYVFPPVASDKWRHPPGMSAEEFADLHSMKNLAQCGDETWDHMQVITHRFTYFPGLGLPENGISTLRASAERRHRNHKFDIVTTRNGHVGDHDFSPVRTTGIKGLYADLTQEDVVGQPVLIRQFQNGDFAPYSTRSEDTIMASANLLRQGRQIVPDNTFFADCRDSDIAVFAAWISHRRFHAYTLLMFYTFTITSGEQLVAEVKKHHPDPQWKTLVKLVLNLYPSELVTLARRYGMPAGSVEDLVAVGKKLLTGLSEAGVRLFALLTMCSGIDPAEIEAEDMLDEEVQRAVFAELAIVKVVEWARTYSGFPNLKIGSGTRAYDVSIPQADSTREFYTYNLKTGDLVHGRPYVFFERSRRCTLLQVGQKRLSDRISCARMNLRKRTSIVAELKRTPLMGSVTQGLTLCRRQKKNRSVSGIERRMLNHLSDELYSFFGDGKFPRLYNCSRSSQCNVTDSPPIQIVNWSSSAWLSKTIISGKAHSRLFNLIWKQKPPSGSETSSTALSNSAHLLASIEAKECDDDMLAWAYPAAILSFPTQLRRSAVSIGGVPYSTMRAQQGYRREDKEFGSVVGKRGIAT